MQRVLIQNLSISWKSSTMKTLVLVVLLVAATSARFYPGGGQGQINNAQQNSNARAGPNGVAIASGTAIAGGRAKRSPDEYVESVVEQSVGDNATAIASGSAVAGRGSRFLRLPLLGGGGGFASAGGSANAGGGGLLNIASSRNTALSIG